MAVVSKAKNGIWIGCRIALDIAQQLAIRGGEAAEGLHLTLAYIPKAAELGDMGIGAVLGTVATLTRDLPPIEGRFSGVGRFDASEQSDGKDVFVALFDSPKLNTIRETIYQGLHASGIMPSQAHGYQPHTSLMFLDPEARLPRYTLPDVDITFDRICVDWPPDQEKTFLLEGSTVSRDLGDPMPFIRKAEAERYTLGIVYEPNTLDSDNEYAGPAAIKRAAWGFMEKLQAQGSMTKQALVLLEAVQKALTSSDGVRLDVTELLDVVQKGRLGDQHASWDDSYGRVVECYVAPCDFELDGEHILKGSWLLGVVWSQEQFAKIKSGERRGYSMGGLGKTIEREVLANAA